VTKITTALVSFAKGGRIIALEYPRITAVRSPYRPDRYQRNIAHELAATVRPSNHATDSNTGEQPHVSSFIRIDEPTTFA